MYLKSVNVTDIGLPFDFYRLVRLYVYMIEEYLSESGSYVLINILSKDITDL